MLLKRWGWQKGNGKVKIETMPGEKKGREESRVAAPLGKESLLDL